MCISLSRVEMEASAHTMLWPSWKDRLAHWLRLRMGKQMTLPLSANFVVRKDQKSPLKPIRWPSSSILIICFAIKVSNVATVLFNPMALLYPTVLVTLEQTLIQVHYKHTVNSGSEMVEAKHVSGRNILWSTFTAKSRGGKIFEFLHCPFECRANMHHKIQPNWLTRQCCLTGGSKRTM